MEENYNIINKKKNPNNNYNPLEKYINSTCILYFINGKNKSKGSGFFIKFKKNNGYEKYIMTCSHVYQKEQLNPNTLKIKYGDGKKELSIDLRNIEGEIKEFNYKNCDALIINVEKYNIPENFFLEYISINKNNINNMVNEQIHIFQYPEDQIQTNLSSGKIKKIDLFNYRLFYNAPTSFGSSGSPIFYINKLVVLGMHQAGLNFKYEKKKEKIDLNDTDIDENQKINNTENGDEQINLGLFIYPIAETIINNLQYKENREENGIYEGEYKNNEKYGYGKMTYNNKEKYIGEWSNNKRNGKGTFYNSNGKKIYEGDFFNDNKNGKGILYYENEHIKYNGDFSNDIMHGKGILYYENGKKKYEGDFANNKKHGKGSLYYENGRKEFIGNFKDDKKNGKGRLFEKNGNFLKGEWIEDKKEGTFIYQDLINDRIERQNYLNDIRSDTKCQKCCKHIKNNKTFYIIFLIIFIIALITSIILLLTYFLLKCEKGERDKCLTCKRWTKSCASCNEGYDLFKGKCITYQFKVTYLNYRHSQEIINIKDNSLKKSILKLNLNQQKDYFKDDFDFNAFKFPNEMSKNTIYFYFDKENIKSFSYMFYDIHILEFSFNSKCDYDRITDMDYMFENTYLDSFEFLNLSFPNLVSMNNMFLNSIVLQAVFFKNFNAPKLDSISGIFSNCTELQIIDFYNYNAKKLTDVSYMFEECLSLISIDFTGFYSNNLNNMEGMFSGCDNLVFVNISSLNTKNVNNMSFLFWFCMSLSSIDLSNFDTSYVINMESMFTFCTSLASLNLSNFNTRFVINMDYMFYACGTLKSLYISNFDTNNVKYMIYLFSGCDSLTSLNISNFETNKVETMEGMFYNCSNLKFIDISNAVINILVDITNIFKGLPKSGKIVINANADTMWWWEVKIYLRDWEIIMKK